MTEKDSRLAEAEKEILLLRDELERLSAPPYQTATVLDIGDNTIRVSVDGSGIYEVLADAEVKKKVERGARVVLNPMSKAIVDHSEFNIQNGELATVEEVKNGRLKVNIKGEHKIVFHSLDGIKSGDEILLDPSGVLAVEKTDNKKTQYHLEKIPKAPWTCVGGLEGAIEKIKEEIEDPFKHREVFERYGRRPAKGILLYGPPGCGKTLLAKCIAYSLAKTRNNANGQFINVKGPEILDKWVGNSEANIRRIYGSAREAAAESDNPVVVFIDEADSVLTTRGKNVSSDVYDTIVTQFLAELDGINGNGNVITVLATNREDMIDPAVLRDGRVDRRIKVPRPNEEGARSIFDIYLKDKPMQGFLRNPKKLAQSLIHRIYDENNIAYKVRQVGNGIVGAFPCRHLVSGAMIKGIVDRACGYAIHREINKGKKGLSQEDLDRAVEEELSENLGFGQSLVKDDWEQVFGSMGKPYLQMYNQGYLILETPNGKTDSQLNATGGKTK